MVSADCLGRLISNHLIHRSNASRTPQTSPSLTRSASPLTSLVFSCLSCSQFRSFIHPSIHPFIQKSISFQIGSTTPEMAREGQSLEKICERTSLFSLTHPVLSSPLPFHPSISADAEAEEKHTASHRSSGEMEDEDDPNDGEWLPGGGGGGGNRVRRSPRHTKRRSSSGRSEDGNDLDSSDFEGQPRLRKKVRRYHQSSPAGSPPPTPGKQPPSRRGSRRSKLPWKAVAILRRWFQANNDYPYPNSQEKADLMVETGLSKEQLNNWFTNQRKRGWVKPPAEHLKRMKEQRAREEEERHNERRRRLKQERLRKQKELERQQQQQHQQQATQEPGLQFDPSESFRSSAAVRSSSPSAAAFAVNAQLSQQQQYKQEPEHSQGLGLPLHSSSFSEGSNPTFMESLLPSSLDQLKSFASSFPGHASRHQE